MVFDAVQVIRVFFKQVHLWLFVISQMIISHSTQFVALSARISRPPFITPAYIIFGTFLKEPVFEFILIKNPFKESYKISELGGGDLHFETYMDWFSLWFFMWFHHISRVPCDITLDTCDIIRWSWGHTPSQGCNTWYPVTPWGLIRITHHDNWDFCSSIRVPEQPIKKDDRCQ